MRNAIVAISLAIAAASVTSPLVGQVPARISSPAQLVEAFARACATFDQAAVRDLTAPDYREISPLGDVDDRAAVIGFYAPEKRGSSPSVAVEGTATDMLGQDAALVTATLRYGIPAAEPGAPARTRLMRAAFVARQLGGRWKLVMAQYTAVRGATAK